MGYNTGSKTDAQFKRLREQSQGHLIRVITDHLTGQLPTLPPDFWPWAEAVIWRDYTPAQKATLIETDYAIDLASATSHYTPFNAHFRLDIGNTFSCSTPLPSVPTSLPAPLLSHDVRARVQQRGPGHYTAAFSQNDFWFDVIKQFELPPSERSHDLPPAMQTWFAAVKALDEPARLYKEAIDLVDSIWRRTRTWADGGVQTRPISCNALMLTVPEWVPMRMLPANRRTALPAVTRLRVETAIESVLTQLDDLQIFDRQQPLLPQLRQLLLPPITAYRLAGKDKELK